MAKHDWNEGVDFDGIDRADVGDRIYLKGTGLWLKVTEQMPPLCKGGRVVQRSVIGRISQDSCSIPGFEPGSLCVLMIAYDSSTQTMVPLESIVYREEVQVPTLRIVR